MWVSVAPDVRLWVDVLGSPDDPPMLLVGGSGWSLDWWDDDFCALLVGAGHRVVRYDQRDTGASTCWPVGSPGYGGRDLVADVVAVLDAVGAARAHLVGLSSGGGLAQLVALEHPDRVAALTLVATSPIDPAIDGLPGPAAVPGAPAPDPDRGDPLAVAEHLVAGERAYAGPEAFDEARIRAIARRVVARSVDVAASLTNPFVLGHVPVDRGGLARLAVPTLVVHGRADPLFPVEHGRALARAIPGARLVELDGVGHQLPPEATWDVVVAAITATTHARGTAPAW